MIVNQKELADCLGISARQVRNLKNDGMFECVKNGKGYHLEKCIQEYIEFKVNAEVGRGTSINRERIQAEHEEVKKQIALLKLRKLRRELHEAADVESFLGEMLIKFKNRLLSLPEKFAIEVIGVKEMNQVIEIIRGGLLDTLEELSEYNPDDIDGQKAEDYYDTDEEEDDDL